MTVVLRIADPRVSGKRIARTTVVPRHRDALYLLSSHNNTTPGPPHPALRAALSPKGGEGKKDLKELSPRPWSGQGMKKLN